jgi:hypothetical protein
VPEIVIEPHARERMLERGANETEVSATIERGERFAAKHDRTGFRRNFAYGRERHGRRYAVKQLEVYAVNEKDRWVVVTVIVCFF